MKYLKTFDQVNESQPSYMNTPTGYKNTPTGYKADMSSELEEDIIDYSGDYESAFVFIESNNLENEFGEIHGDFKEFDGYDENNEDSFKEYVDDSGFDEEIIKELLPKNEYRMRYDKKEDIFIIKKKNKGIKKEDCKIEFAHKQKDIWTVRDIFDEVDIYSEFTVRFKITDIKSKTIIGGSTYKLNGEFYEFDIAILEDKQGGGVGKVLIDRIIFDAKQCECEYLKAEVVSPELEIYLESIGFSIDKSDDSVYAFYEI